MIRLKLEILIQSYLQLTCTYRCIIYSLQFRKQSQMDPTQTHPTFGPPILSSVPMGYLPRLLREITFQSSSEYEGFSPSFLQPTRAGMASVGIKKEGQKKYNIEIADISGKFHFAELFKHTARKNASITSTTIPSSKALVS